MCLQHSEPEVTAYSQLQDWALSPKTTDYVLASNERDPKVAHLGAEKENTWTFSTVNVDYLHQCTEEGSSLNTMPLRHDHCCRNWKICSHFFHHFPKCTFQNYLLTAQNMIHYECSHVTQDNSPMLYPGQVRRRAVCNMGVRGF